MTLLNIVLAGLCVTNIVMAFLCNHRKSKGGYIHSALGWVTALILTLQILIN